MNIQFKSLKKFESIVIEHMSNAVLMDAATFIKYFEAIQLSQLLTPALQEVAQKKTRPFNEFIREFKDEKKIQD